MLDKSNLQGLKNFYPLAIIVVSSIGLFYLYSIVVHGQSLIPSPRGPWIDSGPPLWINWSSAKIVNQALQQGYFPLWSENVGIGVPLLADPHLSFFSPFSFILYFAPDSYGWDIMVISKAALMLICTYLLALRLDLKPWVCAYVAVLYVFCGHVYQFQHHFHTNSLVFIPLMLIALIDIFEHNVRRGVLFAALATPLIIFGGGLLDAILLALLLVFVSISYLLFQHHNKIQFSNRVQTVFFAALIFVLALAIAAVWILPYLEIRQHSIPSRPQRASAHYDQIWYLFGLFIKNSMYTDYQFSHWFMKQYQYLSIIALPGFFTGIALLVMSKSRYNYIYCGFLVLVILQLLKVYSEHWLEFVHHLPLLNDIRYEKYIGVYTLGFYLIAAFGYQQSFFENSKKTTVALIFSTLLVVILLVLYQSQYKIPWTKALFYYWCLAIYPLALLLIWHTRIKSISFAPTFIVLVTTFVVFIQLSIDTSSNFSKRVDLFDKQKTLTAAQKVSATKRFLAIVDTGPRRWSANGFNDVRDISVVHNDRYYNVYKKIIENGGHCWHKFVLCAQADVVFLQGLRWLGVDTLVLTEKNLKLLEKNPDQNWQLAGSKENYFFVKLNDVEPLYTVRSADEFLSKSATLEDLIGDFSEGITQNYLESVETKQIKNTSELTWSIDSVNRKQGRLLFDIMSSNSAVLLIKQQYYPGWKATVNGNNVPIENANYLFQAIPIPAGKNSIELTYSPASLKLGMLISTLAILFLLVIFIRQKKHKTV